MALVLATRKRLALCLLLAFVLVAGGSAVAMSPMRDSGGRSGSRLNVGGSGPGNYTTIQSALDAAQPGDTVYVYSDSSPYHEHLTMQTHDVTLQGERNTTTIVDGNRTGTVISVLAAGCVLRNLSVRGSGTATLDAGVRLSNATSCLIHGVIVSNASIGILATDGSDHGNVSFCTIRDCQTGLSTVSSSAVRLTQNTLTADIVGAYCLDGDHLYLYQNTVDCKSSGLQLDQLTNASVVANTIRHSNDGLIAILCTGLLAMDNTITQTRWMNARISSCTDLQFLGNTITDSDGIGLYLSRSTGSVVTQCLFEDNDDGVLLEYRNQTQTIGNTFYNLKNDAYVITASLGHDGNRWAQNYWTNPRHLPYLISGRLKRNGHNFPFASWDLRPLATPPVPLQQDPLGILSPDTLYVGGSGPGNYTTIQAAVENASNGDTIHVYPGNYTGGVVLPKALTLQGTDPMTTIIDGAGYDDGIAITHDDCSIQGFTVCDGHFGITSRNVSNITITNTIIHDEFHAVDLRNTTQATISGDTIQNNQYGIRLYDASTITVTHNTLKNLKLDAYFVGTTQASCHNTWTRNYWSRPHLIALIHGKYFPAGQPAAQVGNWDLHPLLRPPTLGYQGKINKEQACFNEEGRGKP